MTALALLPASDPLLYQAADPVPIDDPDALAALAPIAAQMLETCKARRGRGLAAPQVGLSARLFVMSVKGGRDYVCINPGIGERFGREVVGYESCLTLPGNEFTVRRHLEIIAGWYDLRGQRCESRFTGLLARVFQHELDHLSGITVWPRAVAQA